ncbi:MAG: hypothetical protein IJA45_02950 [Oscillospiraceae bacterium]|nr:hypothetical protein [Bacteroidaceae bacterium]MBQ3191512.1 hypothetical protein [Bacteroides sp.]MBQ3542063.1 hypothetical protein [Oscillospiraceae bacterium]
MYMSIRKLLCVVLGVAFLFCLTGCNQKVSEEHHTGFTENGAIEIEGISVSASMIKANSGKTVIDINWHNDTDYSVMYGEMYWIQRLVNEEWVDCAISEPIFATIAFELPSKEYSYKSYSISDLYDVSQPGTYRFLSTCTVNMGEEKSKTCAVSCEFVIE